MNFPIYKLTIADEDDETGVDFVALVDSPAIEKNFVAFDNEKELFQVKDKEQRIVSGALMVSNLPIYRRDEKYGEYYVVFDKETINKIVHRFFKKKNTTNVNLMHDPSMVVDEVYMFESFIIDREKGVMPPLGFEKLSDGSWFGSFKVNNDKVWEQIKSGEFKGFSVEGVFKHEFAYDSETLFIDRVRKVLLNELNKEQPNVIYNNKTETMKLNIDEKIKEKISAIKALFNEEVKMTDAKLVDGTIVSYEGEVPVAGAKLFVVDETGKNPAPDASYELEDGTTLTVEGGLIMDVKVKEVEEVEQEVAPSVEVVENSEVVELKKANEDLKAEFDAVKKASDIVVAEFKAEFKKLNDLNKGLFEVIEKITNIPNEEPTKKPASPFSKSATKENKLIELQKQLSNLKK